MGGNKQSSIPNKVIKDFTLMSDPQLIRRSEEMFKQQSPEKRLKMMNEMEQLISRNNGNVQIFESQVVSSRTDNTYDQFQDQIIDKSDNPYGVYRPSATDTEGVAPFNPIDCPEQNDELNDSCSSQGRRSRAGRSNKSTISRISQVSSKKDLSVKKSSHSLVNSTGDQHYLAKGKQQQQETRQRSKSKVDSQRGWLSYSNNRAESGSTLRTRSKSKTN